MFRITPILFIFLGIVGCQSPDGSAEENDSPSIPAFPEEGINTAFLIVDGVYNTELTAPYDIFEHTRYREGIEPMNVFTISEKVGTVTTSEGLTIHADYSYLEDYPRIDVLVIPSAEGSMHVDLENEAMIQFVRDVDKTAMYMTSHCDGAFVLAKAGLLNGINSTTFPADREALQLAYPETIVHDSVLFVHDDKYITSAGGAKSFEAALYLVELLYGKENADLIAEGMVIDWNLEEVPYKQFIPLKVKQ